MGRKLSAPGVRPEAGEIQRHIARWPGKRGRAMSRYLFGVAARTCLQVPLRSRPCSSRHHRTVTRAMGGDNSKKPEGMATKGFPVGPEIKDSAQVWH